VGQAQRAQGTVFAEKNPKKKKGDDSGPGKRGGPKAERDGPGTQRTKSQESSYDFYHPRAERTKRRRSRGQGCRRETTRQKGGEEQGLTRGRGFTHQPCFGERNDDEGATKEEKMVEK